LASALVGLALFFGIAWRSLAHAGMYQTMVDYTRQFMCSLLIAASNSAFVSPAIPSGTLRWPATFVSSPVQPNCPRRQRTLDTW
jgi:hypothetical protein